MSRSALSGGYLILSLALAAAGCSGDPARCEGSSCGGPAWVVPVCSTVTGTGAVSFTPDEGRLLARTDRALDATVYVFGLAAIDTPNVLVAEQDGTILESTDAGCTWSARATVASWPLRLTAAPGGRVWGYTLLASDLYLIAGADVTPVATPVTSLLRVAAAPSGNTVRLVGSHGALWESVDGGKFRALGGPAVSGEAAADYDAAFDPHDLDHVVYGTSTTGVWVTFDAGGSWTQASGLSSGGVNAFAVAISPADGNVVWAEGLDEAEEAAALESSRHLYRSTDGGRTFQRVLDRSDSVPLTNGPLLAPHPTDANVLYFVISLGGSDIYRYDHAGGTVTSQHNNYDGVPAIVFSPASAGFMYLGLAKAVQ